MKTVADIDRAFLSAVRGGDLVVTERALQLGANVNVTDEFGQSALHIAASQRNAQLVAALVAHGANLRQTTLDDMPPLAAAAIAGDAAVLKLMVAHCADLEAAGSGGMGILEYALAAGRLDVARWLIDRGADVECCDTDGEMLLSRLVRAGARDAVELVMWAGAKPEAATLALAAAKRGGGAAATLRALMGGLGWLRLLDLSFSELQRAAQRSNERVRLTTGARLRFEIARWRSLAVLIWHWLAQARARAAVRSLCTEIRTDDPARALAAMPRQLPRLSGEHEPSSCLCPLLLAVTRAARAEPTQRAAWLDLIRALLVAGASGRSRDPLNRRTALHIAVAQGDAGFVAALLEMPPFAQCVNLADANLDRPLHIAARLGMAAAVDALAAHGADVNAVNRAGLSPLHLCAGSLDLDCAERLIQRGANTRLSTRGGRTLDSMVGRQERAARSFEALIKARRAIDSVMTAFSPGNPLTAALRGAGAAQRRRAAR